MMKQILGAGVLITALSAPALAQSEEELARYESAREGQWVYRDVRGDGNIGHFAMFLSWDYSTVLFRASCDQGQLVLDYYGGNGADEPDLRPITLTRAEARDERSAKSVSVKGKPGAYTARYTVDGTLLNVLKPTNSEIMIDAPMAKDDLAEPWYVGDAEPLYRVAQACK